MLLPAPLRKGVANTAPGDASNALEITSEWRKGQETRMWQWYSSSAAQGTPLLSPSHFQPSPPGPVPQLWELLDEPHTVPAPIQWSTPSWNGICIVFNHQCAVKHALSGRTFLHQEAGGQLCPPTIPLGVSPHLSGQHKASDSFSCLSWSVQRTAPISPWVPPPRDKGQAEVSLYVHYPFP